MSSIDHLKIPEEKKTYINQQLNPLLTELVTDCLKSCPQDPVRFMLEWLNKKRGTNSNGPSSSTNGNSNSNGTNIDQSSSQAIRAENEKLKQDIEQLSNTLKEASSMLASLTKAQASKDAEESEEEGDDDDDLGDELPLHLQKKAQDKGPRQSVSAEAYGSWNVLNQNFVPTVIAKSDEQKKRLRDILSKCFMFSMLEDKDFAVLIDAMNEVTAEENDVLIRYGQDGDFLFVVESGKLECYKDINGEEKVVKTCEPSDIFGELALLYNTQRAASVRATEPCVLWQLDRNTFNHVVKDAAAKKRTKYESFLKSVSLLKGMTAYELSQVADALKAETFHHNQHIVTEGENGDKFFIVEYGKPIAEKAGVGKVMEYEPSEYFGELALLLEQPRLATVKAVGDCKVLSLDRRSFKRLLGPLDKLWSPDRYSS